MPLLTVIGDPFLTTMQTLVLGTNARGQSEMTPLAQALLQRYPAAIASYRKQAHQGRVQSGDLWVWRESQPLLAMMVVREAAAGMTRPRYVDRATLRLVRDHQLEGMSSVAIAPLGSKEEQAGLRSALIPMLETATFPIVLYTSYVEGVQADESFNDERQ